MALTPAEALRTSIEAIAEVALRLAQQASPEVAEVLARLEQKSEEMIELLRRVEDRADKCSSKLKHIGMRA